MGSWPAGIRLSIEAENQFLGNIWDIYGSPWVMDSTDLTWLTRLWLSGLGRPIDHCLWLANALGEFRPFSPDSLAIHPYIDWGSQCCWCHTWSVLSWITRVPCRQTPATKRNPGLCIFRFSQTMGSIQFPFAAVMFLDAVVHASGWPCNKLRNPHNLTMSNCSVATHDFSQPYVPLFTRAARAALPHLGGVTIWGLWRPSDYSTSISLRCPTGRVAAAKRRRKHHICLWVPWSLSI